MRGPDGSAADRWISSLGSLLIDMPSWKPPAAPLGTEEFFSLLSSASTNRILGPLMFAVTGGGLPVEDFQLERLREEHRRAMVVAATLEARWPSLQQLLETHGIEAVLLKGLVTGYTFYPESWLRQYGDIDLLVRPSQMEQAVEAFKTRTTDFQNPPMGPTLIQVQKGVTPIDESGFEIDLHQSIAWGGRWLHVTESLISNAKVVDLNVGPARGLDPTDLVFHAAVTMSQTQARLSTLFDFALGIQHGFVNVDRLQFLLAETHAEVLFENALAVTTEWFPTFDWSLDGLTRVSGGRRLHGRWQALLANRKRLAMVMAAQSLPLRERPRGMYELIAPDAEWLETRDKASRVQHILSLPGLLFRNDETMN